MPTKFKIGDKVTINHGSTYTEQIGNIVQIDRCPHPYRADDKMFTWYSIEYKKYINGEKVSDTLQMKTCDTSILEHFDIDAYIDSELAKR
jgi:hypothetical protein